MEIWAAAGSSNDLLVFELKVGENGWEMASRTQGL
jgi:hypothetical protein